MRLNAHATGKERTVKTVHSINRWKSLSFIFARIPLLPSAHRFRPLLSALSKTSPYNNGKDDFMRTSPNQRARALKSQNETKEEEKMYTKLNESKASAFL